MSGKKICFVENLQRCKRLAEVQNFRFGQPFTANIE